MDLRNLIKEAKTHTDSYININKKDGEVVGVSFPDLIEKVEILQSKLLSGGFQPGDHIGIQSPNCLEWVLWDLAIVNLGGVLVAFPEEMNILSDIQNIFQTYNLKLLVKDSDFQSSETFFPVLNIIETEQVLDIHFAKTIDAQEDKDTFSKVFSSGTTGHLKGLVISKKGTELIVNQFNLEFEINLSDKCLIFLPLSNYQQRMLVYGCLFRGASLEFTHFTTIFQALKTKSPTFMVAPPVIYESLYKIYSPEKDKGERLKEGLGGKNRFLITGMAPIRSSTINSFNAVGVNLVEAYGATETGMIAWNTPKDYEVGTVGKLIWPSDIDLDNDGNIFVKREFPLSRGYFIEPSTNAEDAVFIEDGRIATGDIGKMNESGRLILLGRKKDIVITQGGKKFHPSQIEAKILETIDASQVCIVQSAIDSTIIAVISIKDLEDAAAFEQKLVQLNTSFEAYQRVSKFVFTQEVFSMDNKCLTRNMKISRHGVYDLFKSDIEERLAIKRTSI